MTTRCARRHPKWQAGTGKRLASAEQRNCLSITSVACTRTEREAVGDPRPSLEERYGSRKTYVAHFEAAAAALVTDRLLLPADAEAYVRAAKECDRF